MSSCDSLSAMNVRHFMQLLRRLLADNHAFLLVGVGNFGNGGMLLAMVDKLARRKNKTCGVHRTLFFEQHMALPYCFK
jgi:hypothetical protein